MTDPASGAPSEPTAQVPGLPAGWTVVRSSGPLGFITHLVLVRPDGVELEWTSRRHRKLLGLAPRGAPAPGRGRRRPTMMSWSLAALFGIGSVCFAAGSLPVFFDHVDPHLLAWTFAVGSVFFTTAAYLQFHETVTAPQDLLSAPRRLHLLGLVRWRPRRVDWWAAAVQLAGTVFFNLSTFAATRADLSFDRERHWSGSPTWPARCASWWRAGWPTPRSTGACCRGRTARSAGGSQHSTWPVRSRSAQPQSVRGCSPRPESRRTWHWSIPGTFLGAVCFLLGAVLLPVESSRDATATDVPSRS